MRGCEGSRSCPQSTKAAAKTKQLSASIDAKNDCEGLKY